LLPSETAQKKNPTSPQGTDREPELAVAEHNILQAQGYFLWRSVWSCRSVGFGAHPHGGIHMKFYAATSLFVITGVALSAQPALSQSAMGGAPGGGAMAPQPRMAAPPPQAPAFIPNTSAMIPSPMTGAPQGMPTASGKATGEPGKAKSDVYRANAFAIKDAKAPAGGPKQAPSKAPLPSGYAYDANGRIGFVGNTGTSGGAQSGAGATASPPQMNRTGYPNLPSSVDPAAAKVAGPNPTAPQEIRRTGFPVGVPVSVDPK
jgi:hypothetical protein